MDNDRFTGSAKNVAGKVEGAFGDALGDRSTQASGRARQAEGTAQDLYGQAKDVARDAAGAAANYARQFQDETLAEIVRENPVRALWVAGGIGFALALMLRRPSR
jgi:uncharacterized protein YjbJ (UPF0337 family)